jgi:polyphosphate kinase
VRDVIMRQRLIDECLVPYLFDACDAWELQPSGHYVRAAGHGASAQQALIQRYTKF